MLKYNTFANLLLEIAKSNSGNGITFVHSKNDEFVSYSDLYKKSLEILGLFQMKGLRYRDELVLQTSSNKDFLFIFMAAMMGGIRLVPISSGYSEEHKLKFFKIWKKLNNPKLICERDYIDRINGIHDVISEDNFIDIEKLYSNSTKGEVVEVDKDDIIHIQFSSGSTGDPKGVIVTHGGLLANLEAMAEALKLSEEDKAISWMPLTHDMGLVCHLLPIALDINQYSMGTDLFVKQPGIWLDKISKYNITFAQSPNFGLKYVLIFEERGKVKECDLSSLRIILNGAEPISYDLCKEFTDKMGKYGLKTNVICPGYGLAEATLAVSIDNVDEDIKEVIVDRKHLNIGEQVVYIDKTINQNDNWTSFVEEGKTVKYCSVQIRDYENNILPDDTLGIIYLKGINVTQGFYNDIDKTRTTLTKDGWLNTGDLGFISNGKIVIVGRIKDIVFANGQNYYSHDIERVAMTVQGIALGKIAITSARNPITKQEEIVAFIVNKKKISDNINLIKQLKSTVNMKLGIIISQVIFVRQLPKTTSGKVQRFLLGKAFAEGEFNSQIEELKELLANNDIGKEYDGVKDLNLEKNVLDIFIQLLGKKIEVNDNFFEVGISSILLVQAVEEINSKYDTKIKESDLFANFNVLKLCQYIRRETNVSDKQDYKADKFDDIAIVGIGINLPGAEELYQLWENLQDGKELVKELDGQRKEDILSYLNHCGLEKKRRIKKAAYLDRIDEFDNKYFRISPNEAVSMLPGQRLFLENSVKAIEDAGYSIKDLKGKKVGVYVGYIADLEGYKYRMMLEKSEIDFSPTGVLASNIAGRLSFFLDIHGPSMLVDCACSSSLMALKYACQGIWNGDCTSAIVGGVRVMTLPIEGKNRIGIESNDGKTRPFDSKSSGTGDGEGVVSIVIKPLKKAIEDKDNVYAVIKGISSNQDGDSISLSAPNLVAQEQLILETYKRMNINPRTIGYLEAHGTGTIIGDPIEVQALSNAFLKFTNDKEYCSIGSVKGNIGHLYETSGLASIVKCCLMLKYKKKLPLNNFTSVNPKICFEETPFVVERDVIDWKKESYPRRCGVSNFGFSGTNLHAVLEEVNNEKEESIQYPEHHIFALSANSIKSLGKMIENTVSFLNKNEQISISSVCYTMGRRTIHKYRIALLVKNINDLLDQLRELKLDEVIRSDVYGEQKIIYPGNGREKRCDEVSIDEVAELNELSETLFGMLDLDEEDRIRILLRLRKIYLKGADVHWDRQYKKGQLVNIPSYSFDKKRFWIK